MCVDKNLSDEEKRLLDIFEKFYWPNQSPCNQIQSLAHKFPGAKKDPTIFNRALNSLLQKGCIETKDRLSYCLTECGTQAIGAIPPQSGY